MSPVFEHRLRVRYVECDMQGHVFNAHYYTWMDIAHTELWRAVAGPTTGLEGFGVDFVVAESSARYLSPARYDDEVGIVVTVAALTRSTMTTRHRFAVGDRLLAEGWVRHVCVERERLVSTPWPDPVRTAFAPHVAAEA